MLKWQVLLNGDPKTDARQILAGLFAAKKVARNKQVSPLIKTSNNSNQPKRKEKVWPDLLLSQYCVWYLPKGTRNGELIDVDNTKGKHCRCPHLLKPQTSNLKYPIVDVLIFSWQSVFITELVKLATSLTRGNRAICFEHFTVFSILC